MSLYQCIDLIDEQLKEDDARRDHLVQRHPLLSSQDKELLLSLREKFNNRITRDDYANLGHEIELITRYLHLNTYFSKRNTLQIILNDLTTIQRKHSKMNAVAAPVYPPAYQQFQRLPYKIAELRQGKSFRLGNSKGECYGFSFSMVDPALSPYKNPNYQVQLNEQIHHYQKNQLDRQKDQSIIKRTRLTREYFCPNPAKQAEKIYHFAQQHAEKELLLSKRGAVSAHACYVSLQKNGIRYMDPNHGVYLFKHKTDFICFYEAAAKMDKKYGADFRFYQIDELKYDPHNELSESKNLLGKIRTLLTGTKYQDQQGAYALTILGIYFTSGATIGAVIGGLIGSAIMPGIGTFAGSLIGGTIGALTNIELSLLAIRKNHGGLLGLPHFIENLTYSVLQKMKHNPSPATENTARSTAEHQRVEKQEKSIAMSPARVPSNPSRSSPPSTIIATPPLRSTHTFWKKTPAPIIHPEEEQRPIMHCVR